MSSGKYRCKANHFGHPMMWEEVGRGGLIYPGGFDEAELGYGCMHWLSQESKLYWLCNLIACARPISKNLSQP